MTKRYRGDNRLSQIQPEIAFGHALTLQMRPRNVHLFMAIMEGYSHLAFPVAINPKIGLIILHTTPSSFEDLPKIIETCPLEVTVL